MSVSARGKRHGAVAAGHALTVAAGEQVLRDGGTAVDAAIAGLWMACVCEPVLASPGGGGFMMVMPAPGAAAIVLDFFVHTPARKLAEADLDFHTVQADFGIAQQAFHVGAGTVAVPGFVPGLFAAHERFGRMPMRDLVRPAVVAANEGVRITAFQAQLFGVVKPILTHAANARDLYAPQGQMLSDGATLRNPQLADALDAIGHEGARIATKGEIAAAMASTCASGGALRAADIARFQVVCRAAQALILRDQRLLLNPAPSCGGALIAAMLSDLARAKREPEDMADIMALARSMAHVDGRWRAAGGDLDRLEGIPADGGNHTRAKGTTHISIIDGEGMCVAATVSNGEGNGSLVPGCGFMLNNMLGEEDLNPAGFNRWKEDRRLSSMMAPTLTQDRDGAVLALGSGGSNRIRTALFQTIARFLADPDIDLDTLVSQPRAHVEDGVLQFEDRFGARDRQALIRAFPDHTPWPRSSMFFGGVHMARRDGKHNLTAAGDPRREGAAAVF